MEPHRPLPNTETEVQIPALLRGTAHLASAPAERLE